MKTERKVYEIKAGTLEENTFAGVANTYGVCDRGGDVVFPGFFRAALPAFRKQGFVPVGHDWAGLPVAMPTKAEEKPDGLHVEATFHSHAAAQDARTVAQERLQHGLTMGLSVGFSAKDDGIKYFSSGKDLMTHAKSLGIDQHFDNSLHAYKGSVRGLMPDGCHELYEFSIVAAPMNQYSGITDAKNFEFEEGEEGEEKAILFLSSLPMNEYTLSLGTAVRDLIGRVERVREMRQKAGRTLSEATRGKLRGIHQDLSRHCESLAGMLDEDNDPDDADDKKRAIAAEQLRYEMTRARGLGINI